MHRYLMILLLSFLVANLSACASGQAYLSSTARAGLVGAASGATIGAYTGGGLGAGVGAVTGGIVGSALGHFLKEHLTTVGELRANGVKVIVVGENVLLTIPSRKLFYHNSPHRILSMNPLLNDVAKLLRGYHKVEVKVSAYTAAACSAKRAKALTRQQAQSVVDYLWSKKTDTRMMYAVGYGSNYPIASNKTTRGQALNQRVEISLRLLPPCCHLTMKAS